MDRLRPTAPHNHSTKDILENVLQAKESFGNSADG